MGGSPASISTAVFYVNSKFGLSSREPTIEMSIAQDICTGARTKLKNSSRTRDRLQCLNQYRLPNGVSYHNFLHRIHPTWGLCRSPYREDISTLHLLVQLSIHYINGVLLEMVVCVRVPHHLTTPLQVPPRVILQIARTRSSCFDTRRGLLGSLTIPGPYT